MRTVTAVVLIAVPVGVVFFFADLFGAAVLNR